MTNVYRSPSSLFASGSASTLQLEKITSKLEPRVWLKISTGSASGWVRSEQTLSALDFSSRAKLTKNTLARFTPNLKANPVREYAKGSELSIEELRKPWALVNFKGESLWIEAKHLKPINPRSGTFLRENAKIYSRASVNAALLTIENRAQRFLREWDDTVWIKIKSPSLTGYVLREDALAPPSSKNIVALATQAYTEPDERAPRSSIQLTPLTNYSVSEWREKIWGQAQTEHLGEVWWLVSNSKLPSKGDLGNQDFFSRKVYDMARSPAIENLLFASAEGVFRSLNGKSWVRLPLFGDGNYPVSIATNGNVFIGPYLSTDHGQTFNHFIRWDQVMQALKSKNSPQLSGQDQRLHVVEISPLKGSNSVFITLEVARKKISLISRDLGHNWQLVN